MKRRNRRYRWKHQYQRRSVGSSKAVPLLLFLMLMIAVVPLMSCGLQQGKLQKASVDVFAMDTFMNIQVYGEQGEEACQLAKSEIERLDAMLSTGAENSEITKLNQQKKLQVSEDVERLWSRSYEIYEETEGAFDVTIYPIMQCWGFTDGNLHVPDDAEIQARLPLVNASKVKWDDIEKQIMLPENMMIDFGGIAKGYTSSLLVDEMRTMGVQSAMINLGGNVQVLGTKPDGTDWKIGIQNPDGSSDYLGVVTARDEAIITSGGYQRNFVENGKCYHHVIDPATGYPAEGGFLSVTVVTKDGTLGDGLSTALFVMGQERAYDYWRKHAEQFDAIFFTVQKEIWITEGIQDRFQSGNQYQVLKK